MSADYPLSTLQIACLRDDAVTVHRMLASGALFDSRSVHGSRPLHAASRSGTAAMQMLVARGANVRATDDNGLTAIHTAAFANNSEGVQMLLAKGADMSARSAHLDSTALHDACKSGSKSAAMTLLQHGANCLSIGHSGMSPIHYNTVHGHVALSVLLVQHCADVLAVDADGQTAEGIAVRNGFRETTALLQRFFSAQATQATLARREAFSTGNGPRLGEMSVVFLLEPGVVDAILVLV